ncbi:glycogenin-1-like isoform X1 [Mya arenaria]|uniref:glycogenin-1-like isoform X1 n=1 Tax=Mya arenaria TaxID=6604 RepID=UPI0022E03BB5|nr:glycogenin-1-like isoform X1 [Mya arenaria]
MTDRGKEEAFVTLATNDTYSLGCLVLGSSIRRVGTTRQLVVMITEDVSNPMRSQLAQIFDLIQEVNLLDSNDPVNLGLLGRPDLNVTFTKLHCWRLTQFNKCVFLDADTLVLQNVDELFDRAELSAAPDAGWPDCFNSGVFVFEPSQDTYNSLLSFATSQGSFDGGDQGLLNMYFKNWSTEDIRKHLPFIYNVVSQAFYSYLPAFTQFKDTVRIVHFIGAVKPWHHTYDSTTGKVTPLPGSGHSQEFLQVWWNIFMKMVQPNLDPSLTVYSLTKPNVTSEDANKPVEPQQTVFKEHSYPSSGETVQALYPYKPPDVEDGYKSGDSTIEDNAIVGMYVMSRPYSELETHYSDIPLTNINLEEPAPASIYEATRITEGWEAGQTKPEPVFEPKVTIEPQVQNEQQGENESNNNDSNDNQGCEDVHCNEVDEVHAIYPGHDLGASGPTEYQHSHLHSINTSPENPPSPTAQEESISINNENEDAGLVGELASLSIQGASGPVGYLVPDDQRRERWERGQIDYLGQDSFDNIQRKIEKTLNSEAPSEPVLSSPFVTVASPTEVKPAATGTTKITAVSTAKPIMKSSAINIKVSSIKNK